MIDAAYWRKGCSSLGHLRYAVLLQIGYKSDRRRHASWISKRRSGLRRRMPPAECHEITPTGS